MRELSLDAIQNLGYAWPKYDVIEQHCVAGQDGVDLDQTIEALRSIRAYFKGQLDHAFAFKMRTGADYSDFTHRFDDNVRIHGELGKAIAYLEEIAKAAER